MQAQQFWISLGSGSGSDRGERHGGLYSDFFVERLRKGAAKPDRTNGALSPRTEVTLLNISENATFRADDPERRSR